MRECRRVEAEPWIEALAVDIASDAAPGMRMQERTQSGGGTRVRHRLGARREPRSGCRPEEERRKERGRVDICSGKDESVNCSLTPPTLLLSP